MKKYIFITALSLSVAVLAAVAGCSGKLNSEDSLTSTSTTDNDNEPSDSSTESTESVAPEDKFTEEQLKLLEPPAITSFLSHDEETLLATDAVDIYKGNFRYEFRCCLYHGQKKNFCG